MTDLVPYREHERAFDLQPQMIEMAKLLAGAPFVPDAIKGDAAAVFAVIVSGHGLGMDPVASLLSYDFIAGKPYLRTEVMFGMFQRAGHSVAWGPCGERSATVRCTRGDGRGSAEVTYTWAMAERAGYTSKANWRKSPAEMLKARALRTAMKMTAADVFLGAIIPDDDPGETRPLETSVVQIQREPVKADDTPSEQPSDVESTENHVDQHHDAEAEDLVTPSQIRRLNAAISELERLDGKRFTRDERRQIIFDAANIEGLDSAKQLTRVQASAAIEMLQVIIDAATQKAENGQEGTIDATQPEQ